MESAVSASSIRWLAALSALLGGCESCPREGCEALSTHARAGKVAGVVASESDVVANDCQECGFAEAPVRAWRVAEPVADDDDLRAAVINAPDGETTSGSDGMYRLDELPSGALLVCVSSSCFNVEVRDDLTTTLNVRLINGISSGFIGVTGEALQRIDARHLPPDALATP